MAKKDILTVQGTEVFFFLIGKEDYISLTDIGNTGQQESRSDCQPLASHIQREFEYRGLWKS
jgi:hypothetical protein